MNEDTTAIHTEAVAPEGDGGVAATLGLNVQLFAFQLINFLIVILIVWYLILKPLTKKLDERKKMIDHSLDTAKNIELEMKRVEARSQEIIDEAKVEYNRIVEASTADAVTAGEAMKKRVRDEIEVLVTQAKHKMEVDQAHMREEFRAEAGFLIAAAVEKIINVKLSGEKDVELVTAILDSVKQ